MKSNLKEVQGVLLQLLDEFIRVCDKYNLQWFADGGTLLGAVREGKMISWDDDIDIVMPRKDYNILLKIGQLEFKKPFFFQTPITDYYFDFVIRLRHSNTTFMNKYERSIDFKNNAYASYNKGIYIDIFPLDAYPEDEETLRLESETLRFIKNYNTIRFGTLKEYNSYLDITQFRNSFKMINHMMTVISDIHSSSKYLANVQCYAAKKYRYVKFSREAYNNYINISFEGLQHKLRIPSGYDEVLTAWYGENWKVPKQENSGHSFLGKPLYDVDNSYRVYDTMSIEEFEKLFE